MSAHTGVPTREPTDFSPTEHDDGPTPGQFQRLARAATERLFVDTVTPATNKTGLAHVYSEEGHQHTVAIEDGVCSCEDFTYNLGPGERCKHAIRAELALGRRGLPEWANPDVVDMMLQCRLDADGEATDGV